MHLSGRMCLLLMFLLFSPWARAQDGVAPPEVRSLSGAYALDRGKSDEVGRAIAEATRGMAFFVRPFARLRLKGLNEPPPHLEIDATTDTFTLRAEGESVIKSPLDGAWIPWTPRRGGQADVQTVWDNGGVRLVVASKEGRRINRFWRSGDGKGLTVEVQVTSPKLPEPLTYQLVYQRAS